MAKLKKEKVLLTEVLDHYAKWTEDSQKRMTRKGGWNDVTDAYWGKLPDDWPYISKVVDPRIRTSLVEKNARLLNSKLRGRLVPREGSDAVGASINNALLDFQWDNANFGGPMTLKMSISDIDTRLYGSKFAYVCWKIVKDDNGKIIFEGNEFEPLDIRDCGMDFAATHVRDAKWFQHRSWDFIEDLENAVGPDGSPLFKNLDKLKSRVEEKISGERMRSSHRNTEYLPRLKTLKGLEDRLGDDIAYPMVEIVTEYRQNRWITFSPEFQIILRNIPNPYQHGRIPIAQLRYYSLQDDAYGESEVEPVLPLWKAIQAVVCSYLDEVILKMRPPLKIIEGAARIETIEYGPEAQWLVTQADAVTEMNSSGDSLAYFQTTYSALVSAYNAAMGDLSQGVGGVDPFNPEKTATEINATERQRTVRDQKNQTDLADFIKDIMSMWLINNQQFLFSDESKQEFILRIVGESKYSQLKRAGLDELEVTPESMSMIEDITLQQPDMTDDQLAQMYDAAQTPRYPVVENPEETDPELLRIKPKMEVDDNGEIAKLYVTPEDLQGTFDYIPDVHSMSVGANDMMRQARVEAIEVLTTNQTVLSLLQQEQVRPKVKELLVAHLEDLGLNDAQRFFEQTPIETLNPAGGGLNAGAGALGSIQPTGQIPGIPAAPQALPNGQATQQLAQPSPVNFGGAIPQAIQ